MKPHGISSPIRLNWPPPTQLSLTHQKSPTPRLPESQNRCATALSNRGRTAPKVKVKSGRPNRKCIRTPSPQQAPFIRRIFSLIRRLDSVWRQNRYFATCVGSFIFKLSIIDLKTAEFFRGRRNVGRRPASASIYARFHVGKTKLVFAGINDP